MPNDTTFEVTLTGSDKVEIGDKNSLDFKPHIKLNRWDGECFISIKPANLVEEEVEYEVEGDKVKCKYKVKYEDDTEDEFEAEFYPLQPTTVIAKDKDGNDVEFEQNELGGFEFEVILKKKPLTNKIVLDIETQGLRFYYQPPLHPDHPTWSEEDSGYAQCPDNTVGSYSVYHATRGNMHKGKATAEKYKAGKAFHIYRPKITDADGKWVWGDLSLDEQAGTLTTTIPQEFLDTAVYPVSTGTSNFGFEEKGSYSYELMDIILGSKFPLSEAGIADSITIIGQFTNAGWGYTVRGKYAIYDSSKNLVTNGVTEEFIQPSGGAWQNVTLNFTGTKPSLTVGDWYLVAWSNDALGCDALIWFDLIGGVSVVQSEAYNDYPFSLNGSDGEFKFSIYCTYEAEAAPTGQPYISRVQGVQGMRSYGGI